jgi:tripartite-type tricarboxylate transporter receptor subunit TctC
MLTTTLRGLAALLSCVLVLGSVAGPAAGAERVTRFVVPSPAGASPDLMARIMAEQMGATLATGFIVENRPGASGAIAVESILATGSAPALLLAGLDHLLYGPAALGRKGWDPLSDVKLVGLVNHDRWVLVGHSATAGDLALMRRTALERPLRCANGGHGTTQHAICAWVAKRLGMAVDHIPYSQPLLPDLIGGRVDIAVMPVPSAAAALSGNRLAGVMLLARERLPAFPSIPTSAELDAGGLVFEAGLALYASPSLSEAEVDRLHDALQRAQANDAVKKRFIELGVDPVRATREAAAQQLRNRMRMLDEIRLEALGRSR